MLDPLEQVLMLAPNLLQAKQAESQPAHLELAEQYQRAQETPAKTLQAKAPQEGQRATASEKAQPELAPAQHPMLATCPRERTPVPNRQAGRNSLRPSRATSAQLTS